MSVRQGFGLYVHWPFCQAKCPYCDFNSHVSSSVDREQWEHAFRCEIARVSQDLPDGILETIYFGGGTPSLMDPRTVDVIISSARATWPSVNDLEITLEANPTSVEVANFAGFAAAGVNRVSIGVQSLIDKDLRRLGRLHDADSARRAIDLAHSHFGKVSFDMIYARQDQSLEDWERELNDALTLTSGHISLYQLTVEPGTAFWRRARNGRLPGIPDEEVSAEMYALTQALTERAGLPSYEVSNHAAPGFESRHNLIYWRGGDWLGIGPGAHGRYTREGRRISTETYLKPEVWLKSASAGSGEAARDVLDQNTETEERLMMGLRLSEGVPMVQSERYMNKFNYLSDIKMVEMSETHVRATDEGRLVLNAVIRELLA